MNGEMTETPFVPPTPVPTKGPKRTPRRNPNGGLQSKGSTSPSLYGNNKPVPNYMKTTSHSCHDSCKYGINHGIESKWSPPVHPKMREGIRGVVLNPELRAGKSRRSKKMEIAKPQENEDPCDKDAAFNEPEPKDIHELEIITPPEKVFDLFDVSSPVHEKTGEDCEIEISDGLHDEKSKPKPNVGSTSDSVYDGLSLNVVGSSSYDKHESVEIVPIDPLPIDSVSVDPVLTEDSVPTEDSVLTDVPVCSLDEPNNVVKKKNTGKQIVKHTGTCTGTALSQTKGVSKKKEITKTKISREKGDKASVKPRVGKKKDMIQKDGNNTVWPRIKEIQLIDDPKLCKDTKEKKINSGVSRPKVVEQKVKRPVVLVKPPVKPVLSLKLRKFKKDGNGTTSSMENNPSNSNNSDSIKEKTIYVVEPKLEAKKRYHKLGGPSDVPVTKSEIKRKPRNPIVVSSGTNRPPLPLPPHKMTFRRGKVINVRKENSVPIRIRFRRVKVENGADKGQAGTGGSNKGVRKKRENGLLLLDGTTPPTGTPAVVLRRQSASGNKKSDAQGLFNYVIEETASKLVETRKSKVKALVGAFETVISLQEKSV